jgi:hypothetical protein
LDESLKVVSVDMYDIQRIQGDLLADVEPQPNRDDVG